MAIEMFPDSPIEGKSPRISFSLDLSQSASVPVERYIRSGSSSVGDFDFCVFRESFDQDSSSADELFFDGKILPIEVKKRLSRQRNFQEPAPLSAFPAVFLPSPPSAETHNAAKRAAFVARKLPISASEEKQQNFKPPASSSSSSFWGFKRSMSLNCGSGYARTLCPLPLLSRSSSTGSTAARAKRTSLSSYQKQNFSKNYTSYPPEQSQFAASAPANRQRPPLKKNSHSFSNGIRINPVLNVSHANLFGLGSIFSGGKDKAKKKY